MANGEQLWYNILRSQESIMGGIMLSADTKSDQVVSGKVVICAPNTSRCCQDCSRLDLAQLHARLHFFTATGIAAVCDVHNQELAKALVAATGDSVPDASVLVERLSGNLAGKVRLDATTGRISGVIT